MQLGERSSPKAVKHVEIFAQVQLSLAFVALCNPL